MLSYLFSQHYLLKWSCIFMLVGYVCTGCIDDQSLEFNPVLDIPPTCSDGLKNQDETSVDCGGACSFYCSNSILANCTEDLNLNYIVSSAANVALQINRVYSIQHYDDPFEIIAYDKSAGYQITIKLPITKLPGENMKFDVARQVSMHKDGLTASMMIESNDYYNYDYGYQRLSISGEIYLKLEEDSVHVEFCDVSLKEDYFDINYAYQGNVNFLKSEINQ